MFDRILTLLHKHNTKKTLTETTDYNNVTIHKYGIIIPIEYNIQPNEPNINILCGLYDTPTDTCINGFKILSLPADNAVYKYIKYLTTMNEINPEILNKLFIRTIYIVDLAPDKQIYILPPIPSITKHRAIIGNINHTTKQDWFLYTSQKNNAVIARCLKTYPKSR